MSLAGGLEPSEGIPSDYFFDLPDKRPRSMLIVEERTQFRCGDEIQEILIVMRSWSSRGDQRHRMQKSSLDQPDQIDFPTRLFEFDLSPHRNSSTCWSRTCETKELGHQAVYRGETGYT